MSGQHTTDHPALAPTPLDDEFNMLLQEGIAWLYRANPFWAALISSNNLRLGFVPPALATTITTAATDGYNQVWLSRPFFEKIFKLVGTGNRAAPLLYVVLHELAHIMADHCSEYHKGSMPNIDLAALAVDYQVYDMLYRDGFSPPSMLHARPINHVFDRNYQVPTGTEGFYGDPNLRTVVPDADDVLAIYKYLEKIAPKGGGGGSGKKGSPQGGAMSGDVMPELADDGGDPAEGDDDQDGGADGKLPTQGKPSQARESMIAEAVMTAKAIGNMSSAAQRMADALTKSKTPWQKQLANLMSNASMRAIERKKSYRRIGRRTRPSSGPYAVKPGRIQDPKPGVLLVADSSGSIGQADLNKFASECEAILASGKVGYIRVIYCSTEVDDNGEVFKPRDKVRLKPNYSGGTDFEPVWHWQRKHEPDVAAIVYLTDLMGSFGPSASWPKKVPVIWGATTNAHPPFGKTVRIGG